MGGKDDVAIWRRGGGGGGRSTDELHPEPSGHFKLYSASLRVKYRAKKSIIAWTLDLTRDNS